MNDYNYSKFTAKNYDLKNFAGPQIGEKALDFPLKTGDGKDVHLLDFSGDFLVIEMGSITCPLFQGRRKGMKELVSRFPSVSHVILYTREAHPGEKTQAHRENDDKFTCARRLAHGDGEGRTILIDTLEGPAHQAYGARPNSVFIVNKNGCVVFFGPGELC